MGMGGGCGVLDVDEGGAVNEGGRAVPGVYRPDQVPDARAEASALVLGDPGGQSGRSGFGATAMVGSDGVCGASLRPYRECNVGHVHRFTTHGRPLACPICGEPVDMIRDDEEGQEWRCPNCRTYLLASPFGRLDIGVVE